MPVRRLPGIIVAIMMATHALTGRAREGEAGTPPVATATVTASQLNVRVKPGTSHAVVAQLPKGHTVAVLGRHGEWLQIAAPPDAAAWVANAYLTDGKTTQEVHVRAGPGILYGEYGAIPAGITVTPLPETRDGWQRIAPPPGLTAWISARHVALTDVPAAPPRPAPQDEPSPPTDQDAATPPAPSSPLAQHLPVLDQTAEEVTVEGFVVPLDDDAVFVTHAVCARVNDEYFPLCYVHSEHQNLKLWEGQRVRVTGAQRWIIGWQRPVVEIRKITPIR